MEKEQQIRIGQFSSSQPSVLEGESTYFVIKPQVLCLAFRICLDLAQTNFNSTFSARPSCCARHIAFLVLEGSILLPASVS